MRSNCWMVGLSPLLLAILYCRKGCVKNDVYNRACERLSVYFPVRNQQRLLGCFLPRLLFFFGNIFLQFRKVLNQNDSERNDVSGARSADLFCRYHQECRNRTPWLSKAQHCFSKNSSIDKCMSSLCLLSRSFEK
jgi:hypothetical protein